VVLNQFAINEVAIDGDGQVGFSNGMLIQVVDCRHLIATITVVFDHFAVLNRNNWGLNLGQFVERVGDRLDGTYDVFTTHLQAGVLYTITANV
jgi:hypothetical protein